jgi:hypothetical protein
MGANAQTAVPVFTAGQVLTAAQQTQINTGIPVFATTTTRDAAFGGTGEKTLAQGQYAYIEATSSLMVYSGSAWVAAGGGLVFITSGSMTLGSALSFDNCFSATYANYLIMLTHTAGNNLTMRLRASAADITAANYDLQGFFITGGAQTLINQNSLTSWTIANGSGYSQPIITLGNPFAATNTAISSNFQRTDASIIQAIGGRYNATTSADGFSILGTSATVTARVYGIANS